MTVAFVILLLNPVVLYAYERDSAADEELQILIRTGAAFLHEFDYFAVLVCGVNCADVVAGIAILRSSTKCIGKAVYSNLHKRLVLIKVKHQ